MQFFNKLKKIINSVVYLSISLVMKHIDNSVEEYDRLAKNKAKDDINGSEESVLQKLLKINRNYAIVMTFDMLFAGIDTVTITF